MRRNTSRADLSPGSNNTFGANEKNNSNGNNQNDNNNNSTGVGGSSSSTSNKSTFQQLLRQGQELEKEARQQRRESTGFDFLPAPMTKKKSKSATSFIIAGNNNNNNETDENNKNSHSNVPSRRPSVSVLEGHNANNTTNTTNTSNSIQGAGGGDLMTESEIALRQRQIAFARRRSSTVRMDRSTTGQQQRKSSVPGDDSKNNNDDDDYFDNDEIFDGADDDNSDEDYYVQPMPLVQLPHMADLIPEIANEVNVEDSTLSGTTTTTHTKSSVSTGANSAASRENTASGDYGSPTSNSNNNNIIDGLDRVVSYDAAGSAGDNNNTADNFAELRRGSFRFPAQNSNNSPKNAEESDEVRDANGTLIHFEDFAGSSSSSKFNSSTTSSNVSDIHTQSRSNYSSTFNSPELAHDESPTTTAFRQKQIDENGSALLDSDDEDDDAICGLCCSSSSRKGPKEVTRIVPVCTSSSIPQIAATKQDNNNKNKKNDNNNKDTSSDQAENNSNNNNKQTPAINNNNNKNKQLHPTGKETTNNNKNNNATNHVSSSINNNDNKPKFCDNNIFTTKYSLKPWEIRKFFLTKMLWEQFQRKANLYFLVIGSIQLVPGLSPFGQFTTMMTLVVVLLFSFVKLGIEDYMRYKRDKAINTRPAYVLKNFQDQEWRKVTYADICVGDIVRVENVADEHGSRNNEIPCDLILLTSSEAEGVCYVETANLDGETNLKQRRALSSTVQSLDFGFHAEAILQAYRNMTVECERPNGSLYTFSAKIEAPNAIHNNKSLSALNSNMSLGSNNNNAAASELLLGKESSELNIKPPTALKNYNAFKEDDSATKENKNNSSISNNKTDGESKKEDKKTKTMKEKKKEEGSKNEQNKETAEDDDEGELDVNNDEDDEKSKPKWKSLGSLASGSFGARRRGSVSSNVTAKPGENTSMVGSKHGGGGGSVLSGGGGGGDNQSNFSSIPERNFATRTPVLKPKIDFLEATGVTMPVSLQQSLYRGCSLRKAFWVVGVCVATGHETKIMKNSRNPPHKHSRVERMVNFLLLAVLALQLILTITATIAVIVIPFDAWYFPDAADDNESAVLVGFKSFLTFLILFNNFVPISLYVSIEFIKFGQGRLLEQDLCMYYAPKDMPAAAKTTDLNEELGQINFVFCDKTGTLTRNVMALLKFAVSGTIYGEGTTEIGRVAALRKGIELDDPRPQSVIQSPDPFWDRRLGEKWFMDRNVTKIRELFMALGVCHTVVVDGKKLEAESPDDEALVRAAARFDYELVNRSLEGVTLQAKNSGTSFIEVCETLPFNSNRKRMSVLIKDPVTNAFVLVTKGADTMMIPRMSRVPGVNNIRQTQVILNKFAEEGLRTLVICSRTLEEQYAQEWLGKMKEAREMIGREKERDLIIDGLAESIERELVLIGVTGVEDKLQDKVSASIASLRTAGMKCWMLTGDKRETATNIGYACALLHGDMYVATFHSYKKNDGPVLLTKLKEATKKKLEDEALFEQQEEERKERMAENGGDEYGDTEMKQQQQQQQNPNNNNNINSIVNNVDIASLQKVESHNGTAALLKTDISGNDFKNNSPGNSPANDSFTAAANNASKGSPPQDASFGSPASQRAASLRRRMNAEADKGREHSCIIDGNTLAIALSTPDLKQAFYDYVSRCSSVICCRVSPKQKADVVTLMREYSDDAYTTLAIGDGANDVPMIQAAHVGVGISGMEGQQAANSADFAIGQFKHLHRLLLVHGFANYSRISTVIKYSFYKNALLVMTLFYFLIYNSFTGQSLYEEWSFASYNVVFTFFPIVFVGIFDREIFNTDHIHDLPQMYRAGVNSVHLNIPIMVYWLMIAVLQGLVIFFIVIVSPGDCIGKFGQPLSLPGQGVAAYGGVVLVATLQLALMMHSFNNLQYTALGGSLLAFFIFLAVYSVFPPSVSTTLYGILVNAAFEQITWLLAILALVTALLPTILIRYYQRTLVAVEKLPIREIVQLADQKDKQASVVQPKELFDEDFSAETGDAAQRLSEADKFRHQNLTFLLSGTSKSKDEQIVNDEQDWLLRFVDDEVEEAFIDVYVGDMFRYRVGFAICSIASIGVAVNFARQIGNVNIVEVAGWIIFAIAALTGFVVIQFFPESKSQLNELMILLMTIAFSGASIANLIATDGARDTHPVTLAVILLGLLVLVRPVLLQAIAYMIIVVCVYFMWSMIWIQGWSTREESIRAAELLIVGVTSIIGLAMSENFQRKMFISRLAIVYALKSAKNEQKRSLLLLQNVMPASIVADLRGKTLGQFSLSFERASIVTSDVVQFTNFSAGHESHVVVEMLNIMFVMFDAHASELGIEKIKTIGDAYMCASGIPNVDPDHARKIMVMGLWMLRSVALMCREGTPSIRKLDISIRVGAATGMVRAGVVGRQKLCYDVFGDAVKEATDMETNSRPRRLRVTKELYEMVKDTFHFEVVELEADEEKNTPAGTAYFAYDDKKDRKWLNSKSPTTNITKAGSKKRKRAAYRRVDTREDQYRFLTRGNKHNSSDSQQSFLQVYKLDEGLMNKCNLNFESELIEADFRNYLSTLADSRTKTERIQAFALFLLCSFLLALHLRTFVHWLVLSLFCCAWASLFSLFINRKKVSDLEDQMEKTNGLDDIINQADQHLPPSNMMHPNGHYHRQHGNNNNGFGDNATATSRYAVGGKYQYSNGRYNSMIMNDNATDNRSNQAFNMSYGASQTSPSQSQTAFALLQYQQQHRGSLHTNSSGEGGSATNSSLNRDDARGSAAQFMEALQKNNSKSGTAMITAYGGGKEMNTSTTMTADNSSRNNNNSTNVPPSSTLAGSAMDGDDNNLIDLHQQSTNPHFNYSTRGEDGSSPVFQNSTTDTGIMHHSTNPAASQNNNNNKSNNNNKQAEADFFAENDGTVIAQVESLGGSAENSRAGNSAAAAVAAFVGGSSNNTSNTNSRRHSSQQQPMIDVQPATDASTTKYSYNDDPNIQWVQSYSESSPTSAALSRKRTSDLSAYKNNNRNNASNSNNNTGVSGVTVSVGNNSGTTTSSSQQPSKPFHSFDNQTSLGGTGNNFSSNPDSVMNNTIKTSSSNNTNKSSPLVGAPPDRRFTVAQSMAEGENIANNLPHSTGDGGVVENDNNNENANSGSNTSLVQHQNMDQSNKPSSTAEENQQQQQQQTLPSKTEDGQAFNDNSGSEQEGLFKVIKSTEVTVKSSGLGPKRKSVVLISPGQDNLNYSNTSGYASPPLDPHNASTNTNKYRGGNSATEHPTSSITSHPGGGFAGSTAPPSQVASTTNHPFGNNINNRATTPTTSSSDHNNTSSAQNNQQQQQNTNSSSTTPSSTAVKPTTTGAMNNNNNNNSNSLASSGAPSRHHTPGHSPSTDKINPHHHHPNTNSPNAKGGSGTSSQTTSRRNSQLSLGGGGASASGGGIAPGIFVNNTNNNQSHQSTSSGQQQQQQQQVGGNGLVAQYNQRIAEQERIRKEQQQQQGVSNTSDLLEAPATNNNSMLDASHTSMMFGNNSVNSGFHGAGMNNHNNNHLSTTSHPSGQMWNKSFGNMMGESHANMSFGAPGVSVSLHPEEKQKRKEFLEEKARIIREEKEDGICTNCNYKTFLAILSLIIAILALGTPVIFVSVEIGSEESTIAVFLCLAAIVNIAGTVRLRLWMKVLIACCHCLLFIGMMIRSIMMQTNADGTESTIGDIDSGNLIALVLCYAISIYAGYTTELSVRENFSASMRVQIENNQVQAAVNLCERLLGNVLPVTIIERMRKNPSKRIVDEVDDASVLFLYIDGLKPDDIMNEELQNINNKSEKQSRRNSNSSPSKSNNNNTSNEAVLQAQATVAEYSSAAEVGSNSNSTTTTSSPKSNVISTATTNNNNNNNSDSNNNTSQEKPKEDAPLFEVDNVEEEDDGKNLPIIPLQPRISTQQMIHQMNDFVFVVDLLCQYHRVEKIKTVPFLIASGCPTPCTNHFLRLTALSRDVIAFASYFNQKTGRNVSVKAGLQTGKVSAGVLGSIKFIYDVFGDTVNVASRLASVSRPGHLTVAEETAERLRDHIPLIDDGTVELKGKGERQIYHTDFPAIDFVPMPPFVYDLTMTVAEAQDWVESSSDPHYFSEEEVPAEDEIDADALSQMEGRASVMGLGSPTSFSHNNNNNHPNGRSGGAPSTNNNKNSNNNKNGPAFEDMCEEFWMQGAASQNSNNNNNNNNTNTSTGSQGSLTKHGKLSKSNNDMVIMENIESNPNSKRNSPATTALERRRPSGTGSSHHNKPKSPSSHAISLASPMLPTTASSQNMLSTSPESHGTSFNTNNSNNTGDQQAAAPLASNNNRRQSSGVSLDKSAGGSGGLLVESLSGVDLNVQGQHPTNTNAENHQAQQQNPVSGRTSEGNNSQQSDESTSTGSDHHASSMANNRQTSAYQALIGGLKTERVAAAAANKYQSRSGGYY